MKKLHLYLLHPIFLLLLQTILCSGPRSQAQSIYSLVSVKQVSYQQPFVRLLSNDVELGISYFNPSTGGIPRYLNIYAKPDTGIQQAWVVQNLLLDTFLNTRLLTYTISLKPLGMEDGIPIPQLNLWAGVTDTAVRFPQTIPPSAFLTFPCGTAIWSWGPGIRQDTIPFVPGIIPPNTWTSTDSLKKVTRGCTVPNIDLDSLTHNPTTHPGYSGDWNACGPASCANSMEWLEARHPGKINSGKNHREKLEELSKLMKRKLREGVGVDSMIKGKLEFIAKYKLPVHVKFQDAFPRDSCLKAFDTTIRQCAENKSLNRTVDSLPHLDFNWLLEEMKNGEDVEMIVQWVTSLPGGVVVRNSHAVVVTGVEQFNGVKRITIKDDSVQQGPGGTRERPLTMDSSLLKRFPQLKEWGSANSTCYITGFISESYDSTVTYPTGIPGLPIPRFGIRLMENPIRNNSEAVVELILPASSRVRLTILDLTGRTLAAGPDQAFGAGTHQIRWNGRTSQGGPTAAGIYFILVETGLGNRYVKLLKE